MKKKNSVKKLHVWNKKLRSKSKYIVVSLILLLVAVCGFGGYTIYSELHTSLADAEIYQRKTNFIDISSPQCDRLGSIDHRHYGTVGLNGTYLDFGVNPCLNDEIRKFDDYDVYVGTNYPSAHCPGLSARQCGIKAGRHNLQILYYLSPKPKAIWIDVETGPGIPWGGTQHEHRSFLKGMYETMQEQYTYIGYYSNQSMWNSVTGSWQHDAFSWYATGKTSADAARDYCSTRFGGGTNYYVQFIRNDLDHNARC